MNPCFLWVALIWNVSPTSGLDQRLQSESQSLLGLRRAEIVRLDLPEQIGSEIEFAVSSGSPRRVRLRPHSVRAPHFEMAVRTGSAGATAVEPDPSRTVRGEFLDSGEAPLAGSLSEEGLYARVRIEGGDDLWIEPLFGRLSSATRGDHVLYRTTDVLPVTGTCAALATSLPPSGLPPGVAPSGGDSQTQGAFTVAELACDTDYEYFLHWGSPTAVRDRIELVIETMNLQYERDVAITHRLTSIVVQTSPSQPYTATDAIGLLHQFSGFWNAQHGGIVRDMAQLFTGKHLSGSFIGYAWIGTVCTSQAYSVVQSDYQSALSISTDLSAHELGHNWSAVHCTCPAFTMNANITGANVFHPVLDVPQIAAFRDAATCLEGGHGVDLVVSSVSVSPALGPGASYPVIADVRNVGTVRAIGVIQLGAWLSLDGDPFDGDHNDIPMGGTCVSLLLDPGEVRSVQFTSLTIPWNAAPGTQHFVVVADTFGGACGGGPPCSKICESNEFNNVGEQLVTVVGPDAQLMSISAPSSALGGSLVPIGFSARNNGATAVDIPVNVTFGSHSAPTQWLFAVAPGQTAAGSISIPAPPSNFDCGLADNVIAMACTDLSLDLNPSNNCKSKAVSVVEPYWDLRFDVTGEPSSVPRNTSFQYKVRVTNAGNVSSPSVGAITGICLQPGAGKWSSTLGIHNYWTGNVAPGQTKTFNFNYHVPAGAFCGISQYLKTEVWYSGGYSDLCTSGNYDQESIYISCN